MWFWIWCILVLGAGAGGFFLARDLWRRIKVMLRAGAGLSDALEAMSEKVAAGEAAGPATNPRPVDVFADPLDLADLVAERRRLRRSRTAARRRGHAERYERWRTIDL
ncbi:hypothetical protein SAMN05216410_1317 [Sanguibacter gelidistatuariae]|uniref:Uncharacterized protein n=1 Tax=Sanguibacter gelidistatuariae TaxID=1814289 RepID=A0A1G6JDS1_9MICO|nr:hypothetical protein [Sanguibacter gelidistatuariae]SDC16972.1 hypothetical protein SAMN05216410_1317 [Sanguibacter gelidistatuariae]